MKTAVSKSSIDAYHGHKANGFAGQHGIILAVMRPGKLYSRRQIAKASKLETSTVAGRVNEILESGQLEVCGTIYCPLSGRQWCAARLIQQIGKLPIGRDAITARRRVVLTAAVAFGHSETEIRRLAKLTELALEPVLVKGRG
jgi:hypothetical protein